MPFERDVFFRQATLRICGSLDIERSLESSLRFLEDYMPVNMMYLNLFEPSMNAIRTLAAAASGKKENIYDMIPIPKEVRGQFSSEWAMQEDVIIINRPESGVVSREIAQSIPIGDKSFMILPLKLEGMRLGALTMYANGVDRYAEEHARMLSLLNEPFAIAMSNAVRHQEVLKLKEMLADDNQYLHQELLRISGDEIIGADFGLQGAMEMVRQVATLNSPVLLLGETGVGKEVIANSIHYSSTRKNQPFIKVNCGAIPETLIDSELFGHEKGAFTGASVRKRGRFERAHEGTIFLDEIGELPPQAQIRLLRVLQNKEIERVGGTMSIPVDVRIISATHRNLEDMVRSGQFREDLWFRLNVFPIMIPPLRQRKEDIPVLVNYFVERKSKELKLRPPPLLSPGIIDRLMNYRFPGNVRELENMVERALIQRRGQENSGPLVFEHYVSTVQESSTDLQASYDGQPLNLDEVDSMHIQKVLKMTKGKVGGKDGAAQILGINPNTLRSRMKKLGIPYGRQTK